MDSHGYNTITYHPELSMQQHYKSAEFQGCWLLMSLSIELDLMHSFQRKKSNLYIGPSSIAVGLGDMPLLPKWTEFILLTPEKGM